MKLPIRGLLSLNILDSLKEYFILLFSLIFAIFCLLISSTDSLYLIIGYFFFGIAIFWLIYFKGLLGIHVPKELSDDDKNDTQMYYSVDKCSIIDNQKYQWVSKTFLALVILWMIFTIILNGLDKMNDLFDEDIISAIDTYTQYSWFGLAVIVSLLYLTVIFAFLLKRIPNDLKKMFTGFTNRLILVIGLITFIGASIWGINNDLSIESLIIAASLLPIALMVSRVEGKFFYLFSIDQWFRIRNWGILKGEKIRKSDESSWNQLKGIISQIQALIALLILPISLISTFLGSIDFLTGNFASEKVGLLESFVDTLLLTEYSSVVLIFLTLGPLLALISRPFAFTEVWLNQGLYNKISSPWDLDTLNDNMKQNRSLFNFPQKSKGFRLSLFLSSTGILTLLCINLSVSLSTLEESYITFITEGLLVINFVTSIVFFITLIELNWDLIEEKTLWLFGKVSKDADMDLINYSLYGEYLLYKNQNMDNYLESNPEKWALPLFLKGLNLSYDDDERLEAFQSALDENKKLLKSVSPLAWNDYGVLLQRKGRIDEAEKAFIKALKLLGEKTDKKEKKIDDFPLEIEPISNIDAFSARGIANAIDNTEPISQSYVEQASEPISQTYTEKSFISQASPLAQTSDGPSPSRRSREGTLLSYDDIISLDDDESLSSRLEARYRRRGRTKAAMNLDAIRRRQEEQMPILQEIRDLNKELILDNENAEKWEKLGELCLKANFDDKAVDAFQKSADLYQKQNREDDYQRLIAKIEEIE